MKNNILCIVLIPTFAMLYAACQLGSSALGILGVIGILSVTAGALK
ncbi:MAG: hypothetical protein IJT40_03660 [Firmicutes bacterium]|nr:hypothetical protein [Bacillota bacterium]